MRIQLVPEDHPAVNDLTCHSSPQIVSTLLSGRRTNDPGLASGSHHASFSIYFCSETERARLIDIAERDMIELELAGKNFTSSYHEVSIKNLALLAHTSLNNVDGKVDSDLAISTL